ncbi:MAG: hypothetical protein EZS28_022603 [Streblomastix strix]|uniref:Uncharacterized protein n=1 Tax=Streblomastix strix TaxID=222440 RepID=A0A5J4VH05_9EUKA|nr:MAG: hypothetical protein EZS28_022603 [Streblomastix strix]
MLMFLLFADDALFTYDLGLSGRIEDGDYYEDYCDSGVFYEMGDCFQDETILVADFGREELIITQCFDEDFDLLI